MITVVIIKNPFEPWNGREVQRIEYKGSIGNLAKLYDFEAPTVATLNGYTVDYEAEVQDGDYVTICPEVGKGGKSLLSIVAVVALGVVSMGAGAAVAGVSTLGAATGWAAVGGWLTAAGIMFVGNSLIGRFMGVKPDTGRYDYEHNPTYSWNGVQTMEGQNNAIALTYGKVKSAGQTIGKYISVEDNKEYLNWLVSAGEGFLEISDVRLNDNSVSFYQGVIVETRAGDNVQFPIKNFNDTYFTKGLGYQLLDEERIDRAQGNTVDGLIVKIEFSNGLYYANDDGTLGEAWVDLEVQYRQVDGPYSGWGNFPPYNIRITGAQSSALRKEFRVDNLKHLPDGTAEYDVRVKVKNRSHAVDNSRASTRCWWTAVTTIVYDDFCYPCTALVGIKAMATDQLSGSPSLSFVKEKKLVKVYNGRSYEAMPADNPAWAAYDMLHQCRTVKTVDGKYVDEVRGVKKESIIYEQFKEWADFCDEKKLKVNIEINILGELLDVINQNIANCGRGMVVRFGTRFGCIFDGVKQPTQMFGMGNIKAGTFHEEFLPTKDRANCVEVTYTDAANDYERQTITIYGENYDSDPEEKVAQVTYNGITSYEQAYREGVYQLYCNKYQLRTVSFEADVDAIACTIGDVVLVAHDVPQWSYSGRITAVDGQSLILPVELTEPNKSYRIMYRTQRDNLHSSNVNVVNNGNGSCQVYLKSDFEKYDEPQPGDIFDLALVDVGFKPFVVKAITRAQDFTRKIECLEYNENLYNEDYHIPPIEYSPNPKKAKNVVGLNASQTNYIQSNGDKKARIYASWEKPNNGGTFTVLLSNDGENFRILREKITETNILEDVPAGEEYWIKVVTILGVTQSTGVSFGPIPAGIDPVPPDVKNLETEVLADGTRRYYWDFDYPTPNDIAGFRFKYLQGNNPNWDNAYNVQEGLIISQPYEAKTVRQGTHTIMIKAVDNSGQESENYAACLVNFGEPLKDNVLYEVDFSQNNWSKVKTNGFKNQADNSLHAKQTTVAYSDPSDFAFKEAGAEAYEESYDAFYVEGRIYTPASGNFFLLYDIEGISNFTYRVVDKNKEFKQYSTKIHVDGGDTIVIRFESAKGDTDTVLKKLVAVVDVPDRNEHFRNFDIAAEGTRLPIETPNYKTTAVRIDSAQMVNGKPIFLTLISREPCVIQIKDDTGQAISTRADISWQGYERS